MACIHGTTLTQGRAEVEAPKDGPVIRVTVLRADREKAIGLDQQLASLRTDRGRLIVSTNRTEASAVDFEMRFTWRTAKEAASSNAVPARVVAVTEPAGQALRAAMAGSYPKKAMDQVFLRTTTNRTGQCWEVDFPAPASGASLARHFRVARRLVAARLVEMNMMEPFEGTWPPGFRPEKALALYDAEGVGYYGSTLLGRVVDETTLDARTMAVCPEDIREGILDRCIGVLFPGGSGKGIAAALKPDGVRRVRDFVARGGGYFGVCAGSYFAASGCPEYAGMMPLKHDQPWAKGKCRLSVRLTPAGEALFGGEFAFFETPYNCGPVFPDLAPGGSPAPVTVLATFASPATDGKGVVRNEMTGTPAILSMPWEKGRIMVVSPHPESQQRYNALVARAIGWTLGQDPASVQARAPKAAAASSPAGRSLQTAGPET